MDANNSKARKTGASDLDRAIDAMKAAVPPPRHVEEAAARVWARVSESAGLPVTEFEPASLGTCDDFQALIPRYLEGELARARVLLLEDHTSECLPCRRAVAEARNRSVASEPQRQVAVGSRSGTWRWVGIAAAAVLLVGLYSGSGVLRPLLFPIEVSASAQSVRGRLFRVADTDMRVLAPGEQIGSGERVRTAADSGAVLVMADGSRIEMRERSELSLLPAADGVRIRLERGSVIVQAADQAGGHLYVSTDDVDVTVVGTVFSVSEGTKGARVSVLEGEVRVEQGATVKSLLPGEQFNSSQALSVVPIEEEVSWSQDSEQYFALLLELSEIERELLAAVASPELRYSSQLMDLVPATTILYVAIPNVAETITRAYDLFTTRIDENPVTREWWASIEAENSEDGISPEALETMMRYLRSFSTQIRDEVVVSLSRSGPVVLAEVENPDLVTDVLRGLAALSEGPDGLSVYTSLEELQTAGEANRLQAYVEGDLLAISVASDVLAQIGRIRRDGESSGFSATGFYQSLAAIYSEGADWLFAADLDGVLSRVPIAEGEQAQFGVLTSFAGLDGANDLFVDYKSINGQALTRAAVTFNQNRTGVASWIAEAGPMGGLDFVSPEATAVVSALTRDTGSIVAEAFTTLQQLQPEAWDELVAFQQEHRFDLQYDLASALGGEFVFAIDGPLLPVPSWKVVLEVYNAATLQTALERMVFEFNRVAATAQNGVPPIDLTSETSGGRIFHTLRIGDQVEAHYTYVGGYLVVAPGRLLVTQALQHYESRTSLGNSAAFRSLLPTGSQNYCSAVMYQNVGALTSSVSSLADSLGVSGEQFDAFQQSAGSLPPMMGCVIAEPNRILALNEGDSAFNLLSLGGMLPLLERLHN